VKPQTPKPGIPTSPPPGTYDPTISAQVRAGQRGVGDLAADNDLANQRADTTFTVGREQATTGYQGTLADLLAGEQRGKADLQTAASDNYADYTKGRSNLLSDYGTSTGRENEDYATAGSNLARGYANLGRAQTGAAAAHGLVGSGVQTGALAAALQARTANQGRDQQGLDTTHTRTLADLLTGKDRGLDALDTGESRFQRDNVLQSNRLSQDTATQTGRATYDYGQTIGGLARDLQYGTDDRSIALGRAQREQGFFGQDADAEKMYQATSSGLYVPPARPAKAKAKPKKGK
jgi:uncharacterized protein YerC